MVVGRIHDDAVALDVVHRFPNIPGAPSGRSALEPPRAVRRRSWAACGARPRAPRWPESASTPGESTTPCSSPTAGCSALPSTTATRAPTAWSRARTSGCRATELYAVTGIQTLPINTVFQLLADECSSAMTLRSADRIALIPDLFSYWLSGSSGQRGDGRLDDRPARRPERQLGPRHDPAAGPARATVRARADRTRDHARTGPGHPHDRGSGGRRPRSRRGRPRHGLGVRGRTRAQDRMRRCCRRARGRCSASSWGSRSSQPRRAPTTSPTNGASTARPACLANVMGLWLVQECRRHWNAQGVACDYGELLALAADARADVPRVRSRR